MRPQIAIVVWVIFFLAQNNAYGTPPRADSIWNIYKETRNKEVKTELAVQTSAIWRSIGEMQRAGAVLDTAINEILLTGDKSLLMRLYIAYFQTDAISDGQNAGTYSEKMLAIAKRENHDEWLYRAYEAKARVLLQKNEMAGALEQVNRAFYHATQLDEPLIEIECLLLQGKLLEKNGKHVEGFRNFMNALYLAEKYDDRPLVIKCYKALHDFFYQIKNFEKAREYIHKQFVVIQQSPEIDSNALMSLYNDLVIISILDPDNMQIENTLRKVIEYAGRNRNLELKKNAFSIYRWHLINSNQFAALLNLYHVQYPHELSIIRREDTTLYYRLEAYMKEASAQPDSALLFYKLAETRILSEQADKVFLSNFYKRYGEFLVRQGSVKDGVPYLRKAFLLAREAGYVPFIIDAAQLLDSVNVLLNRPDSAYQYAKLHQHYKEQLDETSREDELLQLEIDTETKKAELQRQREEEQKRRRYNLQYMGMVIGITTSFIILAMMGSFKVHKYVIKGMGFFSFIFLFEFIVLLADNEIHHATHGEPWKIMGLKIILIGILLPLHHYVEEKVVHYLSHNNLIDTSRFRLNFLRKHKKKTAEVPAPKEVPESDAVLTFDED